ncbi:hypothetical protein THIOM_002905 [Candidatus Thiomargarita nelsonii]|uniref:Uncharacterized protein n=1 Tax=Candidatus Thiomargarita nelsonii TaxID=1003181 RepID=A0A176RZT6_9GAMM|nr:hypothetical protein THIOM_002905 [Candidatus Thiomargarita nelsonii]
MPLFIESHNLPINGNSTYLALINDLPTQSVHCHIFYDTRFIIRQNNQRRIGIIINDCEIVTGAVIENIFSTHLNQIFSNSQWYIKRKMSLFV